MGLHGLLLLHCFIQETAAERATRTFSLLDVNGDGELNEDEFVEGCLRDKSLADLLNAGDLSGK